jgi:hypothetical protein
VSGFPLAQSRAAFRAAAVGFIPELADAAVGTWDRLEGAVTGALADRPPAMARQLAALLRLLDLLAWLRFGRGLDRLDAARRTALLDRLARSPVLLLRRGIWGLRTLVFLGYYTQPEVVTSLGYHADPAGWDARR